MGNPRRRIRMMLVATLFVLSIFAAQLVRVQGLDSAAVAAQALKVREGQPQVIPASRGSIVDANGVVLASSIERRTVTVDQTAVCTYGTKLQTCSADSSAVAVSRAASELAPLVGRTVDELVPLLTGTRRYVIVAKDVTTLNWRKISALGIPGIYSERTSARTYPQGTTSSSLVGFVRDDGQPGGGLEVMLNDILAGRAGSETIEKAPNGRAIPVGKQQISPAVPGKDVALTINSNLQWYAQNVLAAKVQETQALSGTVVVSEVRTGKLLAVASYPTFDPNNAGKSPGSLTNKAFSDVFEPGSTAKIMTVAAALQEGKVTPLTPMIIPSEIHRSDRIFHDSHAHGTEYRTVAGALAESSNMGLIFIGETMTPKVLETYLRKFGLGAKSGIGFPGESPGILAPSEKWNGSQRYTVTYGQGVSVTAIQDATVFQTIANGGVRIPPRIIGAVGAQDGSMTPTPQPAGVQVVSADVAHQVAEMLEGVVSEEGTAPRAKIPGYRVAGKTGTANRIDPATGQYSGMTASFIGFAPADNPQLVVSVVLQRPVKGNAGGIVAAPVFKDVMTYALQELKIPPTGTKSPNIRIKLDTAPDALDPAVLQDKRAAASR